MTADVRDRLRQLTEAQKDAALTAVLDLADELDASAAEASRRRTPASRAVALSDASAADRIRAVVTAAGDEGSDA